MKAYDSRFYDYGDEEDESYFAFLHSTDAQAVREDLLRLALDEETIFSNAVYVRRLSAEEFFLAPGEGAEDSAVFPIEGAIDYILSNPTQPQPDLDYDHWQDTRDDLPF